MEKQKTLHTIKRIVERVREENGVKQAAVGIYMPLSQYDMDSMDVMAILEEIEETFKVRLFVGDVSTESSVDDLTELVLTKINKKQ